MQLPQRPATQQQQQQQQLPQQQQLDYSKMKSDLTRSPNSRKALLLQAIRWVGAPGNLPPWPSLPLCPLVSLQRLTRSLAPTRDEALRELVSNDILGCVSPLSEVRGGACVFISSSVQTCTRICTHQHAHTHMHMHTSTHTHTHNTHTHTHTTHTHTHTHTHTQCVIGALLRNGDPGVQEQAARLVNAFCSMGMGRAYITQSTHLVRTLCGVVTARLDDTHTQRNVLGSIQKISLK